MRKKLLWAMFVIPLAIALIPNVAMAPSSAPVYIDPPAIIDESMIPGTLFSVDIMVEYVENLWGYQFWMSFNPEVLQGVSVEDGSFLGKHLPFGIWHVEVAPGPGFDNEAGILALFGASVYFEMDPPPPMYLADGGGLIATVTFEVVGYGESELILGEETALLGTDYPPPYPAESYFIFYGAGVPGYFSNLPGPELEMPHGVSGVWEEYQAILVGEVQTTYCMIRNWGEEAAEVQAIFIVTGPGGAVEVPSSVASVGPRNPDGTPSEVIVSASYVPGAPGKYRVCTMLLFKCGCMTEMVPYYVVEETLGGESTTRDINIAYKVKTHM